MNNFRLTSGLLATVLIASTSLAWAEKSDQGYTSSLKASDLPQETPFDFKESPMGRMEWKKEKFGGELSAEFRNGIVAAGQQLKNGQFGPAVGGDWVSLGPTETTRFQNGVNKVAHDTGRARVILPDPRPQHSDTVYLLTSGGGLWKTENFSANKPSWEPKTDDLVATSGGSASFGRTPDVIYLGSGDPFDVGIGGVLFKSTDGADTWSAPFALPVNPYGFAPQRVLDIKVDTSIGSTSDDDIVLVGTDAGLYRSVDGGNSYSYVIVDGGGEAFWAGNYGGSADDWSFAKTSAGWLLARSYWIQCTNCIEVTYVYVSNDGGATWDYIPDPILGDGWVGRTTLSVAEPGDAVIYALSADYNGSEQADVFRSEDGGLNWTPLGVNAGSTPTNPNFFNDTMDIIAGQAFYNQLLQVDPTDPDRDTVWLGGQLGNAVTRDGGSTWTLVSGWLGKVAAGQIAGPGSGINVPYAHADSHTAAVSMASGKKRVFIGNDGGITYSENDGKSWKDNVNYGIASNMIYALVSGTKHPEQTLIGLQDNGTRFRVGKSTTWTGSIGGDGFGVGWSQANDAFSMGSLYYLDIRRWAKNPPNNQAKYDQLLGTSNLAGPKFDDPGPSGYLGDWWWDAYFVTPIATPAAEADTTGSVFYTNTRGWVLRTTDGGDDWSIVWQSPDLIYTPFIGGSAPEVPPDGRIIRSVSHGVGLSTNDLDTIGLAGSGGHFVYTHDGGLNWTDVDVTDTFATWPGYNATAAWAPNNTTVYLGSESPLPEDILVGPYVAKSVDGGNTWTDATGNMPPVPVLKLFVDPNDGDTVYAATWIGVFVTEDGGASWSPLGSGLPMTSVTDMYFPPDGSFIRVSTYGRGVWELAL